MRNFCKTIFRKMDIDLLSHAGNIFFCSNCIVPDRFHSIQMNLFPYLFPLFFNDINVIFNVGISVQRMSFAFKFIICH